LCNLIDYWWRSKNVTVYTTGAIVILALVFIIRSAASHSTSVAQCMEVYHFPVDATYKRKSPKDKSPSSSAVNAAMTVCDLFSWVQVVVMSLVWLVLASTQVHSSLSLPFPIETFLSSPAHMADIHSGFISPALLWSQAPGIL
jgi:hypothetical protein